MKIDDAVILVGGLGSRLGDITKKTPKPLIPIGNKRFLDYLLSKISRHNFKNIYLLCSYKKNLFFNLYNNKKIHNSKITCLFEGYRKGTGGALYKLKNKINKNFLLLNGDTFFDIDLNSLLKKKLVNCEGMLALTNTKNSFNNKIIDNLKINKKNILSITTEKSYLMNGGIYILKSKILKNLKNKNLSLENDILKRLIKLKKIKAYYFNDRFIDIGSTKKLNFLKKNSDFIKNKTFFLDRDGVINEDNGYILDYKKFNFLYGVKKAIKYLNEKRYLVIIITNQACVGKSLLTEKKLNIIHQKMKKTIFNYNKGIIDDIYYSPYYKDSKIKKFTIHKKCRKPNNGMFLNAFDKWNVDIKKSIFIGDKITDKIAAKKSNIKFYLKKNYSLYKQVKDIVNNEK